MGEFAGSWIEPEVSVSDTAHSLVMFLKEMLGVDPRVEIALGGRNGRIKGLLDMEEYAPRCDASRASQAGECKGAKSTERGSEEACSSSGSENHGLGTINPTARVSEASDPTTGGSEVALSSAEIICEDQGVCANAPHDFGERDDHDFESKWDLQQRNSILHVRQAA